MKITRKQLRQIIRETIVKDFLAEPRQHVIDIPKRPEIPTFYESEDDDHADDDVDESLSTSDPTRWAEEMFK